MNQNGCEWMKRLWYLFYNIFFSDVSCLIIMIVIITEMVASVTFDLSNKVFNVHFIIPHDKCLLWQKMFIIANCECWIEIVYSEIYIESGLFNIYILSFFFGVIICFSTENKCISIFFVRRFGENIIFAIWMSFNAMLFSHLFCYSIFFVLLNWAMSHESQGIKRKFVSNSHLCFFLPFITKL